VPASAFIVTKPPGGSTNKGAFDTVVVWATDATAAKALAALVYSGDSSWAGATTTAVIAPAVNYSGYQVRVALEQIVSGKPTYPVDVTVTGDATNDTIDEIAALLVTALNATTPIAGAAYNGTTQVLTVAQTTDALGDLTLICQLILPGVEERMVFGGTYVHQGSSGAAIQVTLPADNADIPALYGAFRAV
jgi:hypothetical protein